MVHPRGIGPRIAGYKPVATNHITLGAYNCRNFNFLLSFLVANANVLHDDNLHTAEYIFQLLLETYQKTAPLPYLTAGNLL